MQLKNGTFCPLIKKDCIGLQCAWFTRVQGYDTNTGNQRNHLEMKWLKLTKIANNYY